MNWTDVLKQYSNHALGAMCSAHAITEFAGKVVLSNRLRAIEQLRRRLGRPESVQHGLQQVGAVEINMLKVLMRWGNHAETDRVRQAVEQETAIRQPTPQAPITPDYVGIPSFEEAAARALCFGLVFSRDNHEIDFKPGKYLYIPEPVVQVLNSDPAWKTALARVAVVPLHPGPAVAPDVVVAASAADFQRDLSRYLRHVRRQGAVSLTTQGWIYKTNFKTFLAALNSQPDAPADEASNARLWFMRRLLTAADELQIDETRIIARDDSTLLKLPMAKRIKQAYEVWCNTGAWNELNRIGTEHQGYDYRRDAPPELSRPRSLIARMVARLVAAAITPPKPGSGPASPAATVAKSGDWVEHWVATSQLIEQIKRSEYEFLFPRKQYYRDFTGTSGFYNTPYYSTNNSFGMTFPEVRDERKGWDMVERQFIVNILTGPMLWLGMVSLGYSKADPPPHGEGKEPLCFRLTNVGAWLLGLADEPTFIESGGRVLVQPSFTVIAMEPISDMVLIALDEFAESQGGDRAISYTLTRQSVYRGQRLGWNAARIKAFLEQHQGGPIPTNIQRSLEEWQAQHQRITFRRSVRVLQYADDAARAGAHEALAPLGLGLQPLSPLFEVIEAPTANPLAREQINQALTDAGWMPLQTPASADPEHTLNALRISDAGEVAFKQAVPSVFALSQLQPFTERAGPDQRLRVSAPSVRAAMSRGTQLDELLAVLAHLHEGPLPAKLEASIRSWAGFYGEARLQPVHVLELSSSEVLNNLLNDPQVGQYLKTIEGSERPLALVDSANAALVRAVLVERGVTVRGE